MTDEPEKDEPLGTLFGFPMLPAEEGTFKEFREHRDKIIFGAFAIPQHYFRRQIEGTFIEETPENVPTEEQERRYQIMHYLAALYPDLSEFQTWKIAGRVIQLCEGRDYYGRPDE